MGHKKLSSTLLYADKSNRVADDEIRAWRRRRSEPPRTPPPSTTPATAKTSAQLPASMRALACPGRGRVPRTRPEARQQAADLTVTWLEPDATGTLTATHHCVACASGRAVADLACAVCREGPLLAQAADPDTRSGKLPRSARQWLDDHGWQLEPRLACPAHKHR